MKKILFLACLIFISTGFGIEYSLRIKALGPDFAYLIPDYETDLYRDPNLYTRDNKFLGITPGVPLTLKLLTSRFGYMGKYDGHYYYYNDIPYYSTRNMVISLTDLWMWDARKMLPGLFSDVWNFTDDLYFSRYEDKTYYFDTTTILQYLFGIPSSASIGKYFKYYDFLTTGIYLNKLDNDYVGRHDDQSLLIFSGKLGLSYRSSYADNENSFFSAYLEIGGPVTNSEINSLPWTVMSNMLSPNDVQLSYFLRTIISRIAVVKGLPINENGYVAVGFRDQYLYQNFSKADTNICLTGICNSLSAPLAIEYRVNMVTVRLGTIINYNYSKLLREQINSALYSKIEHQLSWSSTCGIGWRLGQKFDLDLYKKGISLYYNDIEMCLKFLF
jgi:hypothetical protein